MELQKHLTNRCKDKKSEELIKFGESDVCGFVCEVCGKGFLNSSKLESHKTVHISAKKYICDVEGRPYLPFGKRIKCLLYLFF